MLNAAGGLVLFAALLHAAWNAMLHGHRDRLFSITWMSIAIGLACTAAVAALPVPPRAAWPCIAASGLVHIAYNLSLVRAYRRGDLGQAYPIARGSSPLLVTLGAALLAQEAITPARALGVVLVSAGIIALALQGGAVSRGGAFAAFLVGVTIALYTVIDGIGVRRADGQALGYTAWMFLSYWTMPVLFAASRGARALWAPLREAPRDVALPMAGGLVSLAAYGIVIWAMQAGAMGTVSALRETSVVFAVLIGKLFLGETVDARRWIACLVVAAGAVCLGL